MANKITGETYKQRVVSQLGNWKDGHSLHNTIDDECCPDFSCCNEHINTELKDRQIFYENYTSGDEKICAGMLVGFLDKLFKQKGFKVKTSK